MAKGDCLEEGGGYLGRIGTGRGEALFPGLINLEEKREGEEILSLEPTPKLSREKTFKRELDTHTLEEGLDREEEEEEEESAAGDSSSNGSTT